MKTVPVLAFLSALAVVVGVYLFLSPSSPEKPSRLIVDQETYEDAGVYVDADQTRWLAVPAIDGGWTRYYIDYAKRRDDLTGSPSAISDMARAADQPFAVVPLALESDVRLEGWEFIPPQPATAGIVILHGSGASDRRNGYYVALASLLAEAGYHVVLPDKRGSGRSGGDWRDEPLEIMAQDGALWLAELRERADLSAYGFVGVSQGGTIAPQAALAANADFAIALGTSMTTLEEQLHHEVGNDVVEAGVPGILQSLITDIYSFRAKRRQVDFWQANGSYSPLDQWRKWQGPLFIAYGVEDEGDNVPVRKSVDLLQSEPGNIGLDWRVYDGLGHGLLDDHDQFDTRFVTDLLDWLGDQSAPAAVQAAQVGG